jgi:hypothetical protein
LSHTSIVIIDRRASTIRRAELATAEVLVGGGKSATL